MLTSDQARAAYADGSVAVVAGAGTGKTHMLAHRYLHHLRQGRSPLEVVAVTFTERAASELRARIRREVAKAADLSEGETLLAELEAAQISTLHALAARICRDHPEAAEVPAEFDIQDELEGALDQAEHIEEALSGLPDEVFEALPYSRLKAVIEDLLSDPLQAERALARGSDGWRELIEEARTAALADLVSDARWLEACAICRATEPLVRDKLEAIREAALAGLAHLEAGDVASAHDLLDGIKINVGSQKNWPEGTLRDLKDALRDVRDRYLDAAKTGLITLQLGALDDELERVLGVLRTAFSEVRDHLAEVKRRARRLDYADLEVHALRALRHESVRAYYQRRWAAFLVDEFQDTNPVQADLLRALTEHAVLTIVGDEKQSIYGFRGAGAAVFQTFRTHIVATAGTEVELSESFRTHAALLAPINDCFAPIFGSLHGPLTPNRHTAPHEAPHVEAFAITLGESQKANRAPRLVVEAHELATRIKALLENGVPIFDPKLGETRPVAPGDIAVLTRTWRTLDVFNEIFPALGVPTVHTGGGNLLETREAKDASVLLQCLAEPDDDLALVALLRSPYFAASDPVLYRFKQSKDDAESWRMALARAEDEGLIHAASILGTLAEAARHQQASRLLQLADQVTGYTAIIGNLPGRERKLADYRGFTDLVTALERGIGDVFSVSRRLRRLKLAGVKVSRPKLQDAGAVSLMTLHAAKGLEWPVVAVADLDYPKHGGASGTLIDAELGVALELEGNTGLLEPPALYTLLKYRQKCREDAELARLMYVGLTRSRDRLVLSTSGKTGPALKLMEVGLEAIGMPFAEVPFEAARAVYPTAAVPESSSSDPLILIDP